ncbi:MAG: ABC-F family ATP-binding cassette domain-containing protein [Bacillota bacterium]
MAVLTVQGAAKYHGGFKVFSDVSFLLNEGEKVALVGPNGAGKSTLLRAVAGLTELSAGRVSIAPGTRVGYLSQDPELDPRRTVEEEAAQAFAHLAAWERRLRELEARMAQVREGPEAEALMAEYGRLLHRYEAAGGYNAPARVRQVLAGLGFRPEQYSLPVGALSGGQKVRLGLAKLLLTAPDLMLLDEPTNHLDLEATEWLEEFLRQSRAAALIVSHDRYFLDRVTSRTLELAGGQATLYHGNYSYYLEAREVRLRQQEAEWRRQQEEAERLREYIRRYGAGNRARQARSREKMLERLEARMVERPRPVRTDLKLRFEIGYESGDEVLAVEGLTKAYGDRVVFSGVSLRVQRGDRIGVVGPNGAGKTTLLKVLHGLVPPTAGQVWWGVGVTRAYFSQDLDQLEGTGTVLDEILGLPGMTVYTARSLLARFQFRGEEVEKPVAALSGGERNRLILAKLVLSGANVLLLDEPTNHLDLEARQALEEALQAYPGTLIVVSHDRYFLDRVATKIWEVNGGTITEHPGTYSEWRARRAAEAALTAGAGSGAGGRPGSGAGAGSGARAGVGAGNAAGPGRGPGGDREAGPGRGRGEPAPEAAGPDAGAPARREGGRPRGGAAREARRAQALVRQLEEQIARLEERKAELAARLGDPETYRTPLGRELVAEYEALERELQRLYLAWEEAAEGVL